MRPRGFTLIEMCIVAAIGAMLSLGMARLLQTITVTMQQEQRRLGNEQQAEEALDSLIKLLKQTDPASITLLSPDGASWEGLRFTAKNHAYALFQSGEKIQWQVDRQSPRAWITDCQGLHVAVDRLQDPGVLWIAFQAGKNRVLFSRRIALERPE